MSDDPLAVQPGELVELLKLRALTVCDFRDRSLLDQAAAEIERLKALNEMQANNITAGNNSEAVLKQRIYDLETANQNLSYRSQSDAEQDQDALAALEEAQAEVERLNGLIAIQKRDMNKMMDEVERLKDEIESYKTAADRYCKSLREARDE